MTTPLASPEIAQRIGEELPQAAPRAEGAAVLVEPSSLLEVARFLRETPGLDFDYLASITAVDYLDYFEAVYRLVSMEHNHSLVLKARCGDRENPSLPSVVGLWRGADFQEREVFDLMGIRFEAHPNLRRILTWEGFPGHPLRKDFLG
ncbi:MAG: NADH-quinone oxidoreductase subunit C [Dehalococcoidia bacterium]